MLYGFYINTKIKINTNQTCKQNGTANLGPRARSMRAPMLFRTFLITFLSFVDFYLCIYIKTYKNIELYYKYRLWLQQKSAKPEKEEVF